MVMFRLWGAGFKGRWMDAFQTGTGFSHHPWGGYCKILWLTMETSDPNIWRGHWYQMVNTSDDHMIPRKCGIWLVRCHVTGITMKKSFHPAKYYTWVRYYRNVTLLWQLSPGNECLVFWGYKFFQILEAGVAMLTPVCSTRQVNVEWDQLVLDNTFLEITEVAVVIPWYWR